MAVKTITITEDAYETIKRMKAEDESFSELFRRLGKRRFTIDDAAGMLKIGEREAAAFQERIRQMRSAFDVDMRRRMERVRARLERHD